MIGHLIPPEIINDPFSDLIYSLSSDEELSTILEIGSSSGTGSTAAFIRGLKVRDAEVKLFCIEIIAERFEALCDNVKQYSFIECFNMSTAKAEEFPSAHEVINFYNTVDSPLKQYPLEEVLRWRQQDIDYINSAQIEKDAIRHIKALYHIVDFDMVLIDGSEFTGNVEFSKIDGSKIILLDDVRTFKCYEVRRRLLERDDYALIADEPLVRNGFSAFRKKI
jgi:hypothetical protein